jgi:putative ABC transport system ATP-binding protein/macrolide transport system ATP-binding/permease protein/lipoprotein-releasing system ATP-binding protein
VLADEPTSDLDEDSEAEITSAARPPAPGAGLSACLVGVAQSRARPPRRPLLRDVARPAARRLGRAAPAPCRAPRLRPRHAEPRRSRAPRRLGGDFWPTARRLAFGGAVAFALVLLGDSLVGRYQRMLVQERADKLAALETLALSALRADVKAIASRGNGDYELTLELWNVKGDKPIYVMSPALRAYVQVGRQWIEVPSRPIEESAAQVLKITGRQSYRYVFQAKPAGLCAAAVALHARALRQRHAGQPQQHAERRAVRAHRQLLCLSQAMGRRRPRHPGGGQVRRRPAAMDSDAAALTTSRAARQP